MPVNARDLYMKPEQKCIQVRPGRVDDYRAATVPQASLAKEHDPATFKMTICRFFDAGFCQRGNLCTFAHGLADKKSFDPSRRLEGQQGYNHSNSVANPATSNFQANRHASYTAESRMCAQFKAGHCNKGALCTFAHDLKDLTTQQQVCRQPVSAEIGVDQTDHDPATWKSKLCRYFETGCCLSGDRCTYAHGSDELQLFDRSRRSGVEAQAVQPHALTLCECMPAQLRPSHQPPANSYAAGLHRRSLSGVIPTFQTDISAPKSMSALRVAASSASVAASADLSASSAASAELPSGSCSSNASALFQTEVELSSPSSNASHFTLHERIGPAPAEQLVRNKLVKYDQQCSHKMNSTSKLASKSQAPAVLDKADDRDDFCCPITLVPFVDPVLAADGFTYERYAITDWWKQHNTSPTTNMVMHHKELIPNRLIISMMAMVHNKERRS